MLDIYGLGLYYERIQNKEREEFIQLPLKDEVIKNNPSLLEKYIELYDNLQKEKDCHYYNDCYRDDDTFRFMYLW